MCSWLYILQPCSWWHKIRQSCVWLCMCVTCCSQMKGDISNCPCCTSVSHNSAKWHQCVWLSGQNAPLTSSTATAETSFSLGFAVDLFLHFEIFLWITGFVQLIRQIYCSYICQVNVTLQLPHYLSLAQRLETADSQLFQVFKCFF